MILTWSGPGGSSHTNPSLCVPFFLSMEALDFMKLAYEEALQAAKEDEVPIGCVIVKDGAVLSATHNRKVQLHDATKHAEILAINEATEKLGNWHLDDCDLYVTLEPCVMCAGAIVNSRIRKVYYATKDPKDGAFGSVMDITGIQGLNHSPSYESGLMEEECSAILSDFFRSKRNKT